MRMDEFGRFLIRAAAFCLIGAGAAVASIGIPLIEYAQEERVLHYQVEEAIGSEPTLEVCSVEGAKDWLAECKTSLYMQSVVTGAKSELNRWINILVVLGLLFGVVGVVGVGLYTKAALREYRERSMPSP